MGGVNRIEDVLLLSQDLGPLAWLTEEADLASLCSTASAVRDQQQRVITFSPKVTNTPYTFRIAHARPEQCYPNMRKNPQEPETQCAAASPAGVHPADQAVPGPVRLLHIRAAACVRPPLLHGAGGGPACC